MPDKTSMTLEGSARSPFAKFVESSASDAPVTIEREVIDDRVASPAAGWILVSALVFAPWALGARSYAATYVLVAQIACAFALWLAAHFRMARLPRVPMLCVLLTAWLLLTAWFPIFNAESTYDSAADIFVANPSHNPKLPTTVDARNSFSTILQFTAFLLAIPVAVDLARSPLWRVRLMKTMAAVGLSVVIAALLIAAGLVPWVPNFLKSQPWHHGDYFGPFDYHNSAGAFITVITPIVALRAVYAHRSLRRMFWAAGLGLCYLALFVNNSRTGLVIGIASLPLIACLYPLSRLLDRETQRLRRRPPHRRPGEEPAPIDTRRHTIPALIIPLITFSAIGMILWTNSAQAVTRLFHLTTEMSHPSYPRYIQYRNAWQMAEQRPIFGAGPGSYRLLVQHSPIRGHYFSPDYRPGEPYTVLSFVQQDFLQTILEWGWVGVGGWVLLLSAGFVVLLARMLHPRTLQRSPAPDTLTGAVVLLALLGLYLHSLVDCPLQIPAIQLYAAVLLGFAWGCLRWTPSAD